MFGFCPSLALERVWLYDVERPGAKIFLIEIAPETVRDYLIEILYRYLGC